MSTDLANPRRRRWKPAAGTTIVLAVVGLLNGFAEEEQRDSIDFGDYEVGQTPDGFRATSYGEGGEAGWELIEDEVPPLLDPIVAGPGRTSSPQVRTVLAQTRRDPTDSHFPLYIYEATVFRDFTLTTRFKLVAGAVSQMAGIAFRLQDEQNHYVLRASAYDNTFRFYKYVDGRRGPLIGPERPIKKGVWYALKIRCRGNQIDCWLNGERVMPTVNDNTFREGRIAFWTKSDTVAHFTGFDIRYTPRTPLAERILNKTVNQYPRLQGLEIYAPSPSDSTLRLVAGRKGKPSGTPAGEVENDVVENGTVYYGKGYQGDQSVVTVVYPLDDRNGIPMAAVRFILESFPGQTQRNALVRVKPIIRYIESQVGRADYLVHGDPSHP